MPDGRLGGRGLRHIAMAGGARDAGAGVRGMLKLHKRFAREAIPSGVPHQFVEVSDPFLYFVVKVEA